MHIDELYNIISNDLEKEAIKKFESKEAYINLNHIKIMNLRNAGA